MANKFLSLSPSESLVASDSEVELEFFHEVEPTSEFSVAGERAFATSGAKTVDFAIDVEPGLADAASDTETDATAPATGDTKEL